MARMLLLDFVQVADPVEGDRIVIFERWEDDAALLAFRFAGTPGDEAAPGSAGMMSR